MALTYIDPAKVHWSSPAYLDTPARRWSTAWAVLTAALHAEGAKVFQQLMHGGPTNIPQDGSPPWGASAVPDPGLGMVCPPMTNR